MTITITVPRRIAERARREAEKLGLGLEEYVVELLTQGLDPMDRAVEYIEAAKELLEQSRKELVKDNARQAAEKVWGAAALAIKAYAWCKEGKRLASHGELWEYARKISRELGEWFLHAWHEANTMHTCFYEGWCSREDIDLAYKQVEKLVKEIKARIEKELNIS